MRFDASTGRKSASSQGFPANATSSGRTGADVGIRCLVSVVRRDEREYARAMRVSIEQITEAALSLPSDARALLADRLVESLDPLTDQNVRGAWASEALQRLEDLRVGKVKTVPMHEVFARARAQLK